MKTMISHGSRKYLEQLERQCSEVKSSISQTAQELGAEYRRHGVIAFEESENAERLRRLVRKLSGLNRLKSKWGQS